MQAAESAAACLKPNGCLASFSPCIEQVQRMRGALAAVGFWDVHVYECLLRDYEVRSRPAPSLTAQQGGEALLRHALLARVGRCCARLPAGSSSASTMAAARLRTEPKRFWAGTNKRKRWAPTSQAQPDGPASQAQPDGPESVPSQVLAKPMMEARGHTGYLLFARAATDEPAADEHEAVALPSAEEGGEQAEYPQS